MLKLNPIYYKEDDGRGGGESGVKEGQLNRWVNIWKEVLERVSDLRNQVEEAQELIAATPTGPERTERVEALNDLKERLENAKEERKKWGDSIRDLIDEHPRLADEAEQLGFTNFDSASSGGGGDTGGSGSDPEKGGGEGVIGGAVDDANDDAHNDTKKDSHGHTVDPNDDRLPGKRGRDYHLVRYDGEVYVVYSAKMPNGTVLKTSWKVDKKDYEKMQIGTGDGIRITKEQFQKIEFFGDAKDIARKNSGNIHPLKKFLKGLADQYRGASWLRDKEYMSVVMMGYMEGWDQTEVANKLRQTDWYNERTVQERQWEQVMNDADREGAKKSTRLQITAYLDQVYGPKVNWRKHIDEEDLDRFVLKVAKGVWGEDSFATWQEMMFRDAKKISGTAAWQEEQDRLAEANAKANRPEEVAAQLREQSIQALGYKGKLDAQTLAKWADDIVTGKRSQADFDAHLRSVKKALYPYLDPDENFMDRGSIYKAQAEDVLGRTLSWNDELLSDFTSYDASGNPVKGVAMSSEEFMRKVKKDKRFLGSRTYREQGFETLGFLNEMFNGIPSGGGI